ncbi:MAG: AMP-binding protein [Candidatus Cloacimonetes bacterium]|nr:AMP-binding protein [Candidatus Cloacimonadota bacterium]
MNYIEISKSIGAIDSTFLNRFKSSVIKYPEKIAVVFEEKNISYKEIDEISDKIALQLQTQGIGKGDIVPIILDRGYEAIAAMIAVIKTNAAFSNISIDYPKERIDFIVNDTSAKLIIDKVFWNKMKTSSKKSEILYKQSLPSDPAVIVYTSGSTGKPKGVILSYKAMNMALAPNKLGLTESESFLLISSLSFIGGIVYALSPLGAGKTLHITNDSIRRDAHQIIEYIKKHKIVSAFFPPQMARLILELGDGLLDILITGSEKVRSLYSQKTKVMNSWGASETFGPVTAFEIDQPYPEGAPIGKPYDGSRVYILDENRNILPCGQEGEICVSGQIADGYINLPELTAEKFIQNPAARGEHDAILYRTGDLGFLKDDGTLVYVQRKDWMIKVSGYRIEPGEIESVMKKYAPIREAVVKGFETKTGDTILFSVYTADTKVEPSMIKEAIKKHLPDYMIPQVMEQLDNLPLNTNGKIDRLSIKAPDFMLPQVPPTFMEGVGGGNYNNPKNLETKICSLFEKITGAKNVKGSDNFFDLGGTSLSVTLFVITAENEGLRDKNGDCISYSSVYLNPTPRSLANLLISDNKKNITSSTKLQYDDQYDYTKINDLLSENCLDNFLKGKKTGLGNVLLTGATGFLGIHILYGLLNHTKGEITCLVRKNDNIDVTDRLKKLYFNYFEEILESGCRLKIIEGDMLSKEFISDNQIKDINTVINCAANVAHFVRDNSEFDINTMGVKNLIAFCQKNKTRLIHISTIGVAGFSVSPTLQDIMDETMLYFGQNLENQYLFSKFISEREVLEAVSQGLDAKIMRVGNLMGRAKDGGFQVNAQSNSFIGRLRAYHAIGCFPFDSFLEQVEFSPVGITAGAILHLSGTPESCRVFHVYNNNKVFLGDVIFALKDLGVPIEIVENDVFERELSKAMKDCKRAENLTSLVAYLNAAQGKSASLIEAKNDYTTQVLLRLGWRWFQTDKEYLNKFFTHLLSLGLFNIDKTE